VIVLKFGGTSVANAKNIERVRAIVADQPKPCIVVVSALGGVTDLLLSCANDALTGKLNSPALDEIKTRHYDVISSLLPQTEQKTLHQSINSKFERFEQILESVSQLHELSPKTIALVSSLGEILSSGVIGKVFQSQGLDCKHVDSRDIMVTDSTYLKAKVDFEKTNANFKNLVNSEADVFLMGGFIARDEHGETTTLGRGGSDYTAAIAAAAVDAKELQIWTDVCGILSADPRVVNEPLALTEVSYEEAMELSHFGAKVIYPPTIIPAKTKQIPVVIKNTFSPDHVGTKIHGNEIEETTSIKGISSIKNIGLVSVIGSGMIGIAGFSHRLFRALHNENINSILITQASSEHSITVAIGNEEIHRAVRALEAEFRMELMEKSIEKIRIDENLGIVSVVGNNMRNQIGLCGQIFSALGKNGINIISLAQGSTERSISVVIEEQDLSKAINVLHGTFFENTLTTLHLFIMGVGLVGSELLRQIDQQKEILKKENHIDIKVIGIANSRKMIFDEQGIDLTTVKQQLNDSEQASNHQKFIENIEQLNLTNSVFVDNTASAEVAAIYQQVVAENISIVTCNKIAAASPLSEFLALKKTIQKNRSTFLFETNVGASLPIISTIKDMVASGDRIQRIEAVLSGSLNYIFNEYNSTKTFAEVVKEAQSLGFTEPDPRIDLSGLDVKRKILILSRVSNMMLDQTDVETVSFLPESTLRVDTVNQFFEALTNEEDYFKNLYTTAKEKGACLKVVATFDAREQKAFVQLREVMPDSPYFQLGGKDNIVLITSDRYAEDPLIVRGAGAGAAVTASGVFGDILKVLRS